MLFRRSVFIVLAAAALSLITAPVCAEFRAGAAAVDVTPEKLPVYVNGGMLSRLGDVVQSKVYARAIVCADDDSKLAIVIVDSCMMPRWLLDKAKVQASEKTGIPAANMLIAATHTHSAPSSFGALGTPSDKNYEPFLIARLVEAIAAANENLEPARIGAAVIDAADYTAVRRWVIRPDKVRDDPFGNPTVRANMHAASQSENAVGPTGPEDPDLSIISIQSSAGRPIALLANFANHYVGGPMIGSDYFGMFNERFEMKIAGEPATGDAAVEVQEHAAFVAAMSQGTSGDVWLWDYFQPGPRQRPNISDYTDGMVALAFKAYQRIEYQADATVAIAQAELPLRYRTPSVQQLEWAKRIVAEMGDRLPKNTTEVYAAEAIALHEMQSTKIVLQAARLGDIAITAMPNEVYALTGLKLKALSPLQPCVNIELANGADGYIPPPEQHALGGYNTWAARSAGLELQAEPKIVQTVTQLLEKVADKPRRKVQPTNGRATMQALLAKPAAYYRLDEWAGPRAESETGKHDGVYETGVVFYLEGPHDAAFNREGETNRCAHFAGGRLRAKVPHLGKSYTISLWFWNGLVTDARPVTGYLFSRGRDHALNAPGDHLGLGGTHGDNAQGKLFFFNGNDAAEILNGKTEIKRWTWHHAALVRDGESVRVYLDGKLEIDGRAKVTIPADVSQLFIGGRNDNYANFEGRLDEVAVFDRALSEKEVAGLYEAVMEK